MKKKNSKTINLISMELSSNLFSLFNVYDKTLGFLEKNQIILRKKSINSFEIFYTCFLDELRTFQTNAMFAYQARSKRQICIVDLQFSL